MKKLRVGILVLYVLQTCVFTVLAVTESSSEIFRLAAILVGLGLVITPITLRTASMLTREIDINILIKDLVFSIYLMIAPWVRLDWFTGHLLYIDLLHTAAGNALLPLASACMGFAILGFVSTFTEPVDNFDSPGARGVVRVLRFALGLGLGATALFIMYPVIQAVIPAIRNQSFLASDPQFFNLVFLTTGNPWFWLVNMAMSTVVCFQFFRDWLLKNQI